MRDDEVLAARLADDARIVAVVLDVGADGLPHPLEDGGRAGEVDAGEIGAGERRIADCGARPVDEVDHARGKPGRLVQLHQEVRAVGGRRGGLPDDRVSHQRSRCGEVAGDRGEVEGRDGEHEPLERPVLDPVPDARRRLGLLLVDPPHVGGVEAPEVGELAGGVDLRLMGGLRLAEHRGGVECRAPRPGEQLCRAEEDGGPLLPGGSRPVLPGFGGGGDRAVDLGRTALVDGGEHVRAAVGHHGVEGLSGPHLLAADHEGQLEPVGLELFEAAAQLRTLGTARSIRADRLVVRLGDAEDGVSAHTTILGFPWWA